MSAEYLQIKVCGLSNESSLDKIKKLPIEYIGLNFYMKSPRYIVDKIEPTLFKEFDSGIKLIGVFVDEKIDKVLKLVKNYGLQGVQLHGKESAAYCLSIKKSGLLVIKAFLLHPDFDFDSLEEYKDNVDYFLFDARHKKMAGGTGIKFDWDLLSRYNGDPKFFLSGGLSPMDVDIIHQINHPKLLGVDINSGFEISPGVKNAILVRDFVNSLHQHATT